MTTAGTHIRHAAVTVVGAIRSTRAGGGLLCASTSRGPGCGGAPGQPRGSGRVDGMCELAGASTPRTSDRRRRSSSIRTGRSLRPNGFVLPMPALPIPAGPRGGHRAVVGQRLLALPRATGLDVATIGVSGMVPAVILLDDAGRLLRPSIQQNDARAASRSRSWGAVLGPRCSAARGHRSPSSRSGRPRRARNEPDVWAATHTVLGSYDYVVLRLTGSRGRAQLAPGERLYELATGLRPKTSAPPPGSTLPSRRRRAALTTSSAR